MMNSYIRRCAGIIMLLCLILLIPMEVLAFVEESILLNFETEKRDAILFPFGYFTYVDDNGNIKRSYNEELIKGFEYPNPWKNSQNFIASLREHILYKSSNIGQTLKDIDGLMAHFIESGYIFPRPSYNHFEEGWVSCMDALPVAVSCQLAWEITGDAKYKKYRDVLILHSIKKPKEPSFVLHFPDGKSWLSEYASADPKERLEKEYYVLNGYLIGLHSLKILSYATGDKSLEELYVSSLEKYKEIAEQFYYNNGEWCYYMLSPLDINQTHYVIFETVELDGLYALTGDPFFAEEAQKRRKILSNVLSPSFQMQGEEIKWGILRACAPHPYLIDTHPIEIRFFDFEKKSLTGISVSGGSSCTEAAYMEGTVPPESAYFKVYGNPNNQGNYIYYFEGAIPSHTFPQIVTDDEPNEEGISYRIDFSLAAKATRQGEGQITWGQYNEARITFLFYDPLPVDLFTYWGIPIYSEEDVLIRIVLVDDKGKSSNRYYLPVKPGINTILLHYLGFRNLDNLDLHNIRQVTIRINKNPDSKEDFVITVGDFHVLKNAFDVYQFLKLYTHINK